MKMTLLAVTYQKCPAGAADDLCIGDRCMAWRWAEPTPVEIRIDHKSDCAQPEAELPDDAVACPACGAPLEEVEKPEQRLGYCGLAGVPLY
jgi:hypothetical protein